MPPGLWWDEATQGLDARELLHGQFRLFYPSALGKEPLYIYLTAPFAAAWYGAPFAVRIAGALLSILMVPTLYATGRAMFIDRPQAGVWAGVTAALLWTTNFWAQSISRIGFQVNAFPLMLTVAVLAWLNYVRRPGKRRAVTFGVSAGLVRQTSFRNGGRLRIAPRRARHDWSVRRPSGRAARGCRPRSASLSKPHA